MANIFRQISVRFSDEALEKHRKLHTVKAENEKKKSFSSAKSMLKERAKGPTNYVPMKHKAKKAAKFMKTVVQDLNAKLNKWKEAENKAKGKGKGETGNEGGKKEAENKAKGKGKEETGNEGGKKK